MKKLNKITNSIVKIVSDLSETKFIIKCDFPLQGVLN